MPDQEKIKLVTPEFRGSYVALVTPRSMKHEDGTESEPKYQMTIVLPKKAKETIEFIKKLEVALLKCAQAKHGTTITKVKCKHWPVRDGDASDNESFAGCWTIGVSNKFKPGIIDSKGQKLFAEEDLYSGAWYRVSISPWAWANKVGGKGVSLNLDNVMKVRDDEKFTSVPKPEDDFADLIEGHTDEIQEDELL